MKKGYPQKYPFCWQGQLGQLGWRLKVAYLVPQFLLDREIAAKQAGSVRVKVTNFL